MSHSRNIRSYLPRSVPSPRKLLIFQPVRNDAVDPEVVLFVFLVIGKIAFVSFGVSCGPAEEETILLG